MSRGVVYSGGQKWGAGSGCSVAREAVCLASKQKKNTHGTGCAALPSSLASAREKEDLGKHVHVLLVDSFSNETLC